MQKKEITGYDETKKMLNTLRKLNENKTSNSVIREQQEIPQQVEPEQCLYKCGYVEVRN